MALHRSRNKSRIEKWAWISVLCEKWKISHKSDWKSFLAGSAETASNNGKFKI